MLPDLQELNKDTFSFETQLGPTAFRWYVCSKLSDKRDIFNVEINLISTKPNVRYFTLKAMTFQPLPQDSVYCNYREQLYDVLTLLINKSLRRDDLITVHVTPIIGAPVYDTAFSG